MPSSFSATTSIHNRPTQYCYTETPLGQVFLSARNGVLGGLRFIDRAKISEPHGSWVFDENAFRSVRSQLDGYFEGKRTRFEVRLALGGSQFESKVWSELMRIPYGTTLSYGQIAQQIGHPGAARPVGSAIGRNPISIIVPCHRVIGANGKLTGYAWGVERKAWLLHHERRDGNQISSSNHVHDFHGH